jgi:hypothetical protein
MSATRFSQNIFLFIFTQRYVKKGETMKENLLFVRWYIGLGLFLLLFASSCATIPYPIIENIEMQDTLKLRKNEFQIERGKPVPFLDGLGHYVTSLPEKLVLWNWKVGNHAITEENEEKLKEYLEANHLYNVKVRLNQHAPGGEWSRLKRNKAIHPVWRYTFGAITVIGYTVFPGRAFGGDHYNPFTNTINLYSGHNSIALHEGAHAKDFATKRFKGLSAISNILPLAPLFSEATATSDVISYDYSKDFREDEKADYKILYPAYGTYIAGEGVSWLNVPAWAIYAAQAAVIIPAHFVGRAMAAEVDKRPRQEVIEK